MKDLEGVSYPLWFLRRCYKAYYEKSRKTTLLRRISCVNTFIMQPSEVRTKEKRENTIASYSARFRNLTYHENNFIKSGHSEGNKIKRKLFHMWMTTTACGSETLRGCFHSHRFPIYELIMIIIERVDVYGQFNWRRLLQLYARNLTWCLEKGIYFVTSLASWKYGKTCSMKLLQEIHVKIRCLRFPTVIKLLE